MRNAPEYLPDTGTQSTVDKAEMDAHLAFHRLTVKERDFERVRCDRLTLEKHALIQSRATLLRALRDCTDFLAPIAEHYPNGYSAKLRNKCLAVIAIESATEDEQ